MNAVTAKLRVRATIPKAAICETGRVLRGMGAGMTAIALLSSSACGVIGRLVAHAIAAALHVGCARARLMTR